MPHDLSASVAAAVAEARPGFSGEIRDDRLSRALYATDASIYQIVPHAVALPRTSADIQTLVRICRKHRVPLTARGAGTGLTGGAVNEGIQLDCSRYLTRIVEIDAQRRFAQVEPGVVLDELNAELKRSGLQFAPDVATSSRATIGGMIANNSCGAHSVLYGRTVDHIESIDVVLSDGSLHTFPNGSNDGNTSNVFARKCVDAIASITARLSDEIDARFPKLLRLNGGYGLDRAKSGGTNVNAAALLCGSEGTLGIITSAKLKLLPLPACKGLIVIHFDDLLAALAAVPLLLEHAPAAVELVDKLVLDAARRNPAIERLPVSFVNDPEAVLIVEFFAGDQTELRGKIDSLTNALRERGIGRDPLTLLDGVQQAAVWQIRKSGLGLLMSRPGDLQPYAFVEDTAVDPSKLRDYIERFRRILTEEQVEQAGYYAHASVGCLHIRPVLNLKRVDDVQRMKRIADRISSLALEFGGTMTAEHGDGIVRSGWLEKMYGRTILDAFAEIKRTFDPDNILNPGKIVSPLPMTANLRYSGLPAATPGEHEPDSLLDFSEHGGMAGLAGMCSGVGQCRQKLTGVMCPSYMATQDEKHSTRGRANAMRIALSDEDIIEGLSDAVLEEVMDLCLSCKACKTECPTGVDMARLKAEWLSRKLDRDGVPLRNRLVAAMPELAKWGSRFAPLSNWIARSRVFRFVLERAAGLDRRIPPPSFSRLTFRQWFARHRANENGARAGAREVAYFADTWTNHYRPEVGMAVVRVLESLGFRVIVPDTRCCGRPAVSKGLLRKARRYAAFNVPVLARLAEKDIPIVTSEPSCLSMLLDEYPQLMRSTASQSVARACASIEDFVAAELKRRPDALQFKASERQVLLHNHCHQKALTGSIGGIALLERATGNAITALDTTCCGMAGSFGHETEHVEVSRAIAEQRLLPAVRAGGDCEVAITGFSCREQIELYSEANPRHVIEILADLIVPIG